MNDDEVTRLAAEELPGNLRLSRSVGWTDSESDWRVLHEGALVLGIREAGTLVAQGTLASYGSSGYIGKMVVDPGHQRRGLGGRILDALLAEAERRSVATLGLVATEAGRKLYESRGFAVVGDVIVLEGEGAARDSWEGIMPVSDPGVLRLIDERHLGCRREAMLEARLRESIASCVIERADGKAAGFGLATDQGARALCGPIVAPTEEQARRLALFLFGAVGKPVRIDVPAEQASFRGWLRGLGFREQPPRPELARGKGPLPWRVPARFALAAQAWG